MLATYRSIASRTSPAWILSSQCRHFDLDDLAYSHRSAGHPRNVSASGIAPFFFLPAALAPFLLLPPPPPPLESLAASLAWSSDRIASSPSNWVTSAACDEPFHSQKQLNWAARPLARV
jgi:hypothetical protein